MNKFIVATAMVFGFAVSAQAWTINEYPIYRAGGYWVDVDIEVINDSPEDIVGFAIGMTVDLSKESEFEVYSSCPWPAHATDAESWGSMVSYGLDYDVNYAKYFGMSWDEVFGANYSYAFVTTNLFGGDPIAAGETTDLFSKAFGYGYSPVSTPESPAIAMFTSGAILGETGIDNPNPGATQPVPEPCTLLLFGSGLLGLVHLQRKRLNK